MNSLNSRKLLPLIVAAIALSAAGSVHPVNAAGLLYINPPQQGPFAAGTTVTYQVKVANIDPFNGWDIQVKTDPTELSINATSLVLTPNLLSVNFSASFGFELIHCVNGAGMGCTASDGPGIVHSAFALLSLPPMLTPVSGVLFTINYRAGVNTFSTVHIQNDTITNGTGTPVAHTTQDGVYGIPPADKPPVASFTVTPGNNTPAGTLQTFDASASSDPDGTVTSFFWTFGDGSSSTNSSASKTVTHSYSTAGSFTVTLQVTDNVGLHGTKSALLIVLAPPDCHFVHGKLSWTHHLSLAKSGGMQTFTAHIRCDTAGPEFVQVRVSGMNGVGAAFSAQSTAQSVSPGIVTDITFTAAVSSATFLNTKICFTASVFWGDTATTLTHLSPTTKSGCFAVVA